MPAKNNTRKKSAQIKDSVKYTNMFLAYAAFWRRGFTEWAGTSSRSEYWWTVLMNLLIAMVWLIVFVLISIAETAWYGETGMFTILFAIFGGLFVFATIIPQISQRTRRLHDIGLSAWWWMLDLLVIFPIISIIPGIFFWVVSLLPTKVADNPYHKFNK